jgi:hypothetical protein
MMEDEVQYDEVDMGEVGAVDAPSNIEAMVDAIMTQDYASANSMFQDALQGKVADALDQEKVSIASSIYGDEEEGDDVEEEGDDFEEEDDDFEEEDIESEIEDILDDEEEDQ